MKLPKRYFAKVRGKFAPGEVLKKVRPEPSTGFILNPHKGLTTFQAFNGDPLFPGYTWREEGPLRFDFRKQVPRFSAGYLPTTVSYCRWFWVNFEPENG